MSKHSCVLFTFLLSLWGCREIQTESYSETEGPRILRETAESCEYAEESSGGKQASSYGAADLDAMLFAGQDTGDSRPTSPSDADDGIGNGSASATGGASSHEADIVADPEAEIDSGQGVGVHGFTFSGPLNRQLPALLWYPASTEDGSARYQYNGGPSGQAVEDAPPTTGEPYPLVVFSHGHQGIKEQSYYLAEALAMSGYLVASVDHVGNSGVTLTRELPNALINHVRAMDVSRLIDVLLDPTGTVLDSFVSSLRSEAIAAIGHSRGGWTALALGGGSFLTPPDYFGYCTLDPTHEVCRLFPASQVEQNVADQRITAVVAYAPARFTFTDRGLESVDKPSLIVGTTADVVVPHVVQGETIYTALPTPKYALLYRGGDHYMFSDLCEFQSELPHFGDAIADWCDFDEPFTRTWAREHYIDTTIAFLNRHMKSDGAQMPELESTEQSHYSVRSE